MSEPLLTAEEVAQMLGVEKTWIYRAARRGELPHVRLGRYTRFRRESILQWIADQERKPAA